MVLSIVAERLTLSFPSNICTGGCVGLAVGPVALQKTDTAYRSRQWTRGSTGVCRHTPYRLTSVRVTFGQAV